MTGYRLGRVLGVDVHVHWSWLVIGGLVLWTLASGALPADYPDAASSARLVMAGVITLLFFASLLAHELAHSLVAMARGIPVHRITFFLFGGMAQTSADSRSAGEEFLIAIAGPVMSFLLGGLFFGLWAIGADGTWAPMVVGTAGYLTVLNVILGTFNLLPGFPMDGGRVLRAIIWKGTGDVTTATRWASRVGVGMAILLMGYGVWEILDGAFMSGMWLILIGMFIRNAARASYRHHLVGRLHEVARGAVEGRRRARRPRRLMSEIPEERLPPGFADTVDAPPADPVEPVPAATVVLLRDGDGGPEALLMRRDRKSGFVPGAWVFPGGRVDPADGGPGVRERCVGLADDPVPDAPFWLAAIREAFEETGVLLARLRGGDWARDAASEPAVERIRRALMDDDATLADVIERLDVVLDVRPMVHTAHWVTPVVEPRRYDTHFFVAVIPPGREARADPREMADAVWLRPAAALDRFEAGALPMVFPTVKTLEGLTGFDSCSAVLDAFRDRPVERILPRLVRTDAGVRIVIDNDVDE